MDKKLKLQKHDRVKPFGADKDFSCFVSMKPPLADYTSMNWVL